MVRLLLIYVCYRQIVRIMFQILGNAAKLISGCTAADGFGSSSGSYRALS